MPLDGDESGSGASTGSSPSTGHKWTSESAREARKRRGTKLQRGGTDDAIERSLRDRALTDPRAAEILLRWLARPKSDVVSGVDLDALTEAQLQQLHEGLIALCSMPSEPQRAALSVLVERGREALNA